MTESSPFWGHFGGEGCRGWTFSWLTIGLILPKHLAPAVTQTLTDFEAILQLDLNSRRELLKTSARASVGDQNLDAGIRDLHSATLFLVKQDRQRDEFKTLFGDPINRVVRFALKKQIEIAEKLVQTLALKLYSPDFKTPHTAALQALIDAGKTVLDDVRSASLKRTDARLDIRTWKENANAVRMANHGELLTIAAKTGRTKIWVEAFFLSADNTPDDEEDSAETPPPATAPTAG